MKTQFIVTLVGPDRPGLLKELARKTHDYGGRWLASKVNHLEGRFAGLIKVEIDPQHADALQQELNNLPDFQLVISSSNPESASPAQPLSLIVDAADRPGLINEITHLLASHGINIDRMDCHRVNPGGMGSTVFTAELSLSLPAEIDSESLLIELEGIDQQLVARLAPQ